ncbi:MAG: MBL fold metallo-hydrolase [Thermoguttaceae bacterium]|nr:MBL fold metallo-hydrolase [Thermoguttaceae bacterium]
MPSFTELHNELLFLGTGTSHGVPVVGCECDTCRSSDPRDSRTRCSVLLGLPDGHLLIDTPPELRVQLLRERVGRIDAVVFTHEHADHLFGLDDLRVFPKYLGHDLPVYCSRQTEECIRRVVHYAFDPVTRDWPAGGVPRLDLRRIDSEPFDVLGATIQPIVLPHGRFDVLGLRLGDVAYCTDTNGIPPASRDLLAGLDVLILDCLRRRPHPTHLSLDEAIATARGIGARRTLFTHIAHDLKHDETSRHLPAGMELAYDGLRVDLC